MKIVVGLGNPGDGYAGTRHNIGFAVIDELAQRLACRLRRSLRCRARMGRAAWEGEPLLLVKPQTYMNNSGLAVAAVLRWAKQPVGEMIVVLDDADLEWGRLRIRSRGSSGGHRGLDSVIQHTGGGGFARVRVGIGRGERGAGLRDYVLASWSSAERASLEETRGRAADAVLCIVSCGVEAAMNRYNGPGSGGPAGRPPSGAHREAESAERGNGIEKV